MADLIHLSRHFSSMTDEKLLHIAAHEKHTLTKEARCIFAEVYKTRGLDAATLEPDAKELAYDKERHWLFAWEETRAGKNTEEICRALLERGVSESEAALIINCLPEWKPGDEDFETYIKHQCEHVFLLGNAGRMLLAGFSIGVAAYGIMNFFVPFTILGIILLLLAVFLRTGATRGGSFWVERLRNQPESIVWIKPIVEKHKMWYLITLFKTNKFQLLTRDGHAVTFVCDDPADRQIFINGIKKYIPHAHIGYSFDIAEMYEHNPADFINAVQDKNVYTPAGTILLV